MRQSEVAPHLRPYLVPVEGKPNVCAMIAPPTPRQIPPGSGRLGGTASSALAHLAGAMSGWPDPDVLTRTLARREAVQSSQIEGTRTELDELLTYELTRSADGLPPDVRITQHYVEALQHGLDAVRRDGRQALTLGLVNAIHAVLMEDERTPRGQYRDIQAWIGSGRIEDARYVPTPPHCIAECMRELEQSMLQYEAHEEEQGELSVLAQMAIAHAQFETIHPYEDGNGRTGRILMPLILAAEGLPPLYLSGMLMRNRAGYYDALNQVQLRGEWGPWMDMVSRAVIESAGDVLVLAEDLRRILADWEGQLQVYRRDAVARRLPSHLVEHPVVNAKQVAEILGVSLRAALTGIDELVGLGILSPKDERRWGRVFHAEAVLERLNQAPSRPSNLPRL